jgi:hypothetical protein
MGSLSHESCVQWHISHLTLAAISRELVGPTDLPPLYKEQFHPPVSNRKRTTTRKGIQVRIIMKDIHIGLSWVRHLHQANTTGFIMFTSDLAGLILLLSYNIDSGFDT